MRALLLALLASCAADPTPAPSCQDAVTHFYSVGCEYKDRTTGAVQTSSQVAQVCVDLYAQKPACKSELDAWAACLDARTGGADCDCSVELQAVTTCGGMP